MNIKGSYTAVVAVIIIVVIATAYAIMTPNSNDAQKNIAISAVNDVKNIWQNTLFLTLNKISQNCDKSQISILELDEIEDISKVKCKINPNPIPIRDNINFELTCSKSIKETNIEYEKNIKIQKKELCGKTIFEESEISDQFLSPDLNHTEELS